MASLVSLGHLLAGVVIGGVVGLIFGVAIPAASAGALMIVGAALGGFVALQRRKFS